MSSHPTSRFARALRVITSLLLATAALVLALQTSPAAKAERPPGDEAPAGQAQSAFLTASGSVTAAYPAFVPAVVTITTGSSVEWTNSDTFTHTTTSDIGLWNQVLGPGQVFSMTFAAPGDYTYHCMIHPIMQGEVVVLAFVYLPVIMRS